MTFFLGKTRVSISFWFLLGLALFSVADRSFVLTTLLAAILLHECVHLLLLRLYGARVRALSLRLYGAAIDCDLSALPARRRAAVYLCAPVLNLLLGGVFYLWAPSSLFGAVNLCLGVFNLLPIPPLDGGNAAETLCRSPRQCALLRLVSCALLALGAAASAALGLAHGNFTLLICTLYLIAASLARGLRR